jgi:hypothetical protein
MGMILRIWKSSFLQIALWCVLVAEGGVAVWLSRPWVFGDNAYYLTLAQSLAHGYYGSLTAAGVEPDAVRPPGYPWLLYLLHWKLQLSVLGIVLCQHGAYLLTIFFTQQLLRRHGYDGPILLLLAAAYPALIMYGTRIVPEPWTGLLLMATVLLLERDTLSVVRLLLAGTLLATAAYFRSDLLPVPLFVGVALILRGNLGRSFGRRALLAAMPILAAAVLLLPYAAWNEVHFRWPLPTPVAGAVGTSLYLATWQQKLSNDDVNALYRGVTTPQAAALGLSAEVRSINRRLGVDEKTAPWVPGNYPSNATRIGVSRLTKEMAFKRIAADPGDYAWHVVRNNWRLWQGEAFPSSLPRAAVVAVQIASWLIFLLGYAVVILSLLRPTNWRLSALPAAVLLAVPAVLVWLHTEARYTTPVRPILLLLAAATIYWLWAQFRGGRAPQIVGSG